jgi:hypothetical protein
MQIELKVRATERLSFRQDAANRDPQEYTELEVVGSPRVLMPTPQFLANNPLFLPEFTLILQVSPSGSIQVQIIPQEASDAGERKKAIEAHAERRKKREIERISRDTEVMLNTQAEADKRAQEAEKKARESGGPVPEDALHRPGLSASDRVRIDQQNRAAGGSGGTLGAETPSALSGSGAEGVIAGTTIISGNQPQPITTPGSARGDSGDKEPGHENVKRAEPKTDRVVADAEGGVKAAPPVPPRPVGAPSPAKTTVPKPPEK